MTTRADMQRLQAANKGIVQMARNDLESLFAGLDLSNAPLVTSVLADAVPLLVREYGNLAAAVAADWYEELRIASGAKGVHREQLSPGVDPAAVAGSVRAGATGLFEGDAAKSLAFLNGAMQRHISYSTRDTIRRNVTADPARPRYARVTSGAKTCAFCTLLSSRGFVYVSKKSAGENPSDYHDLCDCMVVPDFDAERSHIEGYDPDAMYGQYKAAYLAGNGTIKDTVAHMRRMNPDAFTDSLKPSAD